MRIAIPIIFLVFFAFQSDAQTLHSYINAADEAMEKADYYSAYHFMQIAKDVRPKEAWVRTPSAP